MPRRILEGNVVSAKTDKTVTVLVERRFMHPMYKKYVNSSTKYTAHDETNSAKEGDRVSIIECRPISKTKRWMLISDEQVSVELKEVADKASKAAKDKEEKKAVEKKPAAKKAAVKKTDEKTTKASKKDA